MAARIVRSLAPNLNCSGSVNVKPQQGHPLGSITTSRRFCAQSVTSSSESRIRYVVRLELPPEREEELSSNAEEKEKWYHSFISGGKRTGVGLDKDPRIQHVRTHGVGFSALLTREEALALKEYDGFVCARPGHDIPFPSAYPTRLKNEIKKTSLCKDLDLHIYASDEMKEKMMLGPRKREYMMRDGEGEATLHST